MAQLLNNLPIGAKVKFGKYSVEGETPQNIIWLIANNNGASIVTLLANQILDVRCFDAGEPSSTAVNRPDWGNNRYSVSNLDQWLNKDSAAGAWYVAQHGVDAPPSSGDTSYSDRPGFLNAFTTHEKNAILNTTIRVVKPSVDGGGYEDIVRRVFLPALSEIGIGYENNTSEGMHWTYFNNNSKYTTLTPQAYNYSKWAYKTTNSVEYWLRTPLYTSTTNVRTIDGYGNKDDASAAGAMGVRPALNLSSSAKVSDTVDSEGCYTFIWNTAPNKPTTIATPTIYGGKSNTISWGTATDPDGDAVTYTLECSVNGGSYTQIYSGTALSYAHLVTFGTSNITYRVKATDPSGESSGYTTSSTLTVVNNYAPVISGADANLGVKSSGFTGTYSVADANNNAVTVTESIDGVQIRSLVATLGATITYGITGNTWLTLPNGAHTLTIRATDGLDSSVRTITFTKLVDSFTIENSTPWASSTMPTRIMLVVTRVLPASATFKVEVCNNGNDTSPIWEDATDAVKSGLVHVFANQSKVSGIWGVKFRVTVNRNGATGACYVSAIGGNFE